MNEPLIYTARFERKALKSLENLPADIRSRVLRTIFQLERAPRPHGSIKLSTGDVDYYRVRVGNYRVVYQIIDNQLIILVVAVDHRKDVYRDF